MTIAQQIAHDFLASIEKVCVENKNRYWVIRNKYYL